jgi:hypothetical protein
VLLKAQKIMQRRQVDGMEVPTQARATHAELLFQQRDMRAAANSGTRRAVPLLFACQA